MASGFCFSVGVVAAVTGVIFAVRPFAPVLSLGVLYVFAVLPVSVLWGLAYAVPVSVASMLAFNWFFLPPLHTLALRDSGSWLSLAVYLVTAVVVSEFAARARRRAGEAEERAREAALLADAAALLLESEHVLSRLPEIAERAGRLIGVQRPRIELDSLRKPEPDEAVRELRAGDRGVGRFFFDPRSRPRAIVERILPALATLLAVAADRERLGREALTAEALRRSDAMKTAILRAVSHDLRSPLTAIRAACDGLRSDLLELDPSDRETLLETIRSESERLEHLVTNLLDLSRLESGATEPRLEIWPLDALLGRALGAVRTDPERVELALPPEVPAVRVDATQVERILVNLIENALRHAGGEPVRVEVTAADAEVVVRVADRGPGIAPRDLDRIFEPFERAGERGGAGLGLAIARGFAHVNGGRLWAESEPGRGATFALALPAAPSPAVVPT